MSAPHPETPDTPPRSELEPGKRLQQARLAAGLGLEEVAAQLHLDSRTVRHIEADNYSALPAPTFVRGYLRSYARLVKLSPEPIVEAYDRGGHEPPPIVAGISNGGSQAHSGDFPVRIVTYLIVAGLVGLVAVWWQNQRPIGFTEAGQVAEGSDSARAEAAGAGGAPAPDAPQRPADAPESDAAALAGALSAENAPVPEPAGSGSPAPGAGAPGSGLQAGGAGEAQASTLAAIPEIAPRGASADGQAESEPAFPARADSLPPEASAGADGGEGGSGSGAGGAGEGAGAGTALAAAAPEPSPEPAPETAPDRSPGTSPDHLEMHFEHDSWVEVYNRHGTRLYYDLARSGETISLRDQGPFKVLLGYARDARIEYNGVPFDLEPHMSREIARFQLGDDQAARQGSTETGTAAGGLTGTGDDRP